ncbi:FecR family protein [Butyricimonas paravirosa]|uniref:FecR family protein n=1 Tax=Butyricimonas paravirosa TaxID=1472417 RepID=UPI0022E17B22|nr:FecR family protein [Butyricimonas paravirosa]
MDPIIQKQWIASLMLKENTVGLNEAEREELNLWRQADPRNERTYTRLHEKDYKKDLSRYRQIDVQHGLERYRERYTQKKTRYLAKWYWSAAAVVFMIGIGSIFFFQKTDHIAPQESIVPGSSKAMLVLNNGNIINLSDKTHDEIVTTEELIIRNNGTELQYATTENATNKHANNYNELIVPKGGEYTLTLSDGTKVWLNSQSKLKYPVAFNDTNREVYLEGEAYFEVTKDPHHPFHVNAKDRVTIEVLGTSFNVRSYPDETKVETVLEEGSVRMSKGKEKVTLSPGYKAVYQPEKGIETTSVNTELYTAWRHGQYIFVDESVENILKQLSRWYNIEVFYSNEKAKSVIFSGDVRKYNDITTLLEAMEIAGGIHFKINGNTLIVSYKE